MQINLVADSSVSSAPAGFTAAIEAAAEIFDQDFPGNYTVNIRYGWGTWNNQPAPSLTNPNSGDFSLGGAVGFTDVSYATVKSWLTAAAALSDQITAVASLPASYTALPDDANTFFVSSAQQKALGVFAGSASAIDGAIGFNIGDGSNPGYWETAALCEIGHALGWDTDFYAGEPTILDLCRYSSPGQYEWVGGQPAYFSIDGGTTDLANFSTSFDYTLFTNVASDDPFNVAGASTPAQNLTSLDTEVLNVIGFGSSLPTSVTGENFSVRAHKSVPISAHITVLNQSEDSITEYAFFDAGGGRGHFTFGGTRQPNGQWLDVAAGDLAGVRYVGGSHAGSQTLSVELYDATIGAWSSPSSFTATTIGHSHAAMHELLA